MVRIGLAVAVVTLLATSASAEKGQVEVTATTQWINRIGGDQTEAVQSGEYRTDFESGGGVGVGVNYFIGDRWSLELKGAALRSRLAVRLRGSDYEYTAELPGANIFPINVVAQYHFRHMGSWQPYVGIGVSYVVVQDVQDVSLDVIGIDELQFDEQGGLVTLIGSNFWFAERWSVTGDVRYVPIETTAQTRFGTNQVSEFDVRPLIVSAGVRYRF